ncbi:MAG: hypothetical protein ABIX01_24315 [Chitinophagaceae bacterium]
MVVLKNGNTGIGLGNPFYKLHLGNSKYGLRIEGPALPGSDGDALSISSNGNVNIDAPFIPGGRFTVKENGNTGIGISEPSARLQVADSSVVFTGPLTVPLSTTYDPPVQGAGTRMMWYAQRAAFRVGGADVAQWDKNNLGSYSFGSGLGTIASGYGSTATGGYAVASGLYATAMGISTNASGFVSTAMGNSTAASGDQSVAIGTFITAKSFGETAIGVFNTNSTPSSSTAWNATDRLFVIGNGADVNSRSNAMTVLKNGNTGIGVSVPAEKLEVAGKIKTTNLQITAGAGIGNVLVSDAAGNASWQLALSPVNYWTASGGNIYNNNAGNVGIGIAAPNAPLQFATSNQKRKIVLFETANNDNQYFGFGVFGGQLRYQTGVTTDDHVFYAGASSTVSNELMRIKGNGNVGIGTSSPNAPLQFANSTTNRKIVFYEAANNDHQFNGFGLNPGMLRYQVNNTGDDHVFYAGASSTTSNELLRIKGNGNVGVANSAPASTLDVNGALATKATYYGSGSGNVTLDNSATVWIFAINGFSVSLPDPTSCANRRYTIVNKTNAAMTCSSFYNMTNAVTTSIPAYGNIEVLASNNTNRWELIR